MKASREDLTESSRNQPSFSLDRRVLLGTLTFVLFMFMATWIGARGFLPGAQLFPDVLAGFGVAVTLAAILRVWRGIEPGNSPGQARREDVEAAGVYRKAFAYIGCTAVYYVGVYLIGFLPATALLLIVVARAYALSNRYAAISTVVGVTAVYVLSATLDLYLPLGWIVELFVGG